MNNEIASIEISWTKHEDNIGHVVFDLDHKDGKKYHKIPYFLDEEYYQCDAAK
jgi:hypothetical protein